MSNKKLIWVCIPSEQILQDFSKLRYKPVLMVLPGKEKACYTLRRISWKNFMAGFSKRTAAVGDDNCDDDG